MMIKSIAIVIITVALSTSAVLAQRGGGGGNGGGAGGGGASETSTSSGGAAVEMFVGRVPDNARRAAKPVKRLKPLERMSSDCGQHFYIQTGGRSALYDCSVPIYR